MTLVKLCGIKRACDVDCVNALNPAYAGFVFAQGRSRYIDPASAADLVSKLNPDITPVGVFLNAEPAYVAECCRRSGVKTAQVHGDYGNDYIAEIKRLTGLPVIQAFRISNSTDVERARCSEADLVLLDNGYGGTGETFDWSLLRDVGRDFLLAGGLTSTNVMNAIDSVHPYAVDVSSGIETDGLKDPEKMSAFMDAVREADSQ